MLSKLTRVDKGLIFGWVCILSSLISFCLPIVNTNTTLTLGFTIILLAGLPFGILGLIGLASGINLNDDIVQESSKE